MNCSYARDSHKHCYQVLLPLLLFVFLVPSLLLFFDDWLATASQDLFFSPFFICPAPVLLVILTCFLCGMASFPLFFWATGLVVTSLTPCLILNLFCSFSIRPAMANGFHECCGCSWTSQIGDLISSNYQDFLKFGCLFKIAFGRAGGLWGCSFFLLFCSYN